MDEKNFQVASDLCDEAGLDKPAEMLREMSSGTATVFIVVHHETEYDDEVFYTVEHGTPKQIYYSKDEALAEAAKLNAKELKSSNPFMFGFGYEEVLKVKPKKFEAKVSEIMGIEFSLPDPNDESAWDFDRQFFRGSTQAQMLEIAKLFKTQHFQVVETQIVI